MISRSRAPDAKGRNTKSSDTDIKRKSPGEAVFAPFAFFFELFVFLPIHQYRDLLIMEGLLHAAPRFASPCRFSGDGKAAVAAFHQFYRQHINLRQHDKHPQPVCLVLLVFD